MLLKISSYRGLEAEKLMAVYAESNLENTDYFFPDETDKEAAVRKVEESFLEFLRNDFFTQDGALYWVLEENGAWVSALRTCKIQDGLYYLEALETVPELRKKGYGSRLLSGVLEAMKKEGPFRLCDCVSKRNAASLKTHEKCGFAIVSEEGYDYLLEEADDHDFGLEYRYEGEGRVYKYILFDLDGTLTDSGPGIKNGFVYAIEKMGGTVTDRERLGIFVGPPLKVSFGQILGYSPEDTEKAIRLYREYYNEMGGVFENSVYPGVTGMLSALKEAGKKLIIVTSKSAIGTNTVLDHFDLRKYFEFVATADDKDRPRKSDVIRYAFEQCGIEDKRQAVMVGDRENDITAANETGIDSIGVLYGYGDREELTKAGATYLAQTPEDVVDLVL